MAKKLIERGVAAATAAALVLAGCATLDEQQRKWVFQPSRDTWWGGAAAAEGMNDVWIDFRSAESGAPARLHGLWLAWQELTDPSAGPSGPALWHRDHLGAVMGELRSPSGPFAGCKEGTHRPKAVPVGEAF